MQGRVGLTYDTGGLIAAARGDPKLWRLHRQALAWQIQPVVPAVVLAQAWRGGARQAHLARLLAGCRLVDFTAADGYLVGRALAASGTSDIVDAAVVVGALRRAEVVVTSDPQDLQQIADALGAPLTVHVL